MKMNFFSFSSTNAIFVDCGDFQVQGAENQYVLLAVGSRFSRTVLIFLESAKD